MPSLSWILALTSSILLVLDLGLDVFNSVIRINIERDVLSSQCLHEDLHATDDLSTKMQDRVPLDAVVLKGVALLELLACEDETLLARWDALLVMDHLFETLNLGSRIDIKRDVLTSHFLDEDLRTTDDAENKMQRRVFLNRVVLNGVALLELLACEDETLLSWWDALLVLDLGLDVFNILSFGSTSSVMCFPVNVFTKICIIKCEVVIFAGRNKENFAKRAICQ